MRLKASVLPLSQIPSSAFGDGSHATTRLCSSAVDFLCRQYSPQAVLDVGTGTGILARIARAHGASFVIGTDIDPIALESARANADLDDSPIDLKIIDARTNAPEASPDFRGAHYNLIVANILEQVIKDLARPLVRALAPGGRLLLSGFTRIQVPSIQLTYTELGLILESQSQQDEWTLLLFRKPA